MIQLAAAYNCRYWIWPINESLGPTAGDGVHTRTPTPRGSSQICGKGRPRLLICQVIILPKNQCQRTNNQHHTQNIILPKNHQRLYDPQIINLRRVIIPKVSSWQRIKQQIDSQIIIFQRAIFQLHSLWLEIIGASVP